MSTTLCRHDIVIIAIIYLFGVGYFYFSVHAFETKYDDIYFFLANDTEEDVFRFREHKVLAVFCSCLIGMQMGAWGDVWDVLLCREARMEAIYSCAKLFYCVIRKGVCEMEGWRSKARIFYQRMCRLYSKRNVFGLRKREVKAKFWDSNCVSEFIRQSNCILINKYPRSNSNLSLLLHMISLYA